MRRSVADRILVWIADWLTRLSKVLHGLPSMRTFALLFTAALVLFVLVRFLVAASVQGEDGGRRMSRRGTPTGVDPWQTADGLLEAGRYEEAAHALYRGVIVSLASSDRLRLDPSKTSGDYARELRRRSSAALSPFVAFARRFEVLVYGRVPPDAAAVVQLRALAIPFRERSRAA